MVPHSRAPLRTDRLRSLNAPEPVVVELVANEPQAVRRSKDNGGGQAIETVLETWRIDDEWWRHPISRRYYEVMLESGKRVVLFEDLVIGCWFVQQP
jgi:hypothetical protein